MSSHSVENYIRRQSTDQLLAILGMYLSNGRRFDYQLSLPIIISVLETRQDDAQSIREMIEKVRHKMKEDEERYADVPEKVK